MLGLVLTLWAFPAFPAAGGAIRGCEDIYPAMALGPFPADAATTSPLFYAPEDSASASFKVRWTGFACGQTASVSAEYGDEPGSAAENSDYVIADGQRTPSVCETGCPKEATIGVPLVNDLVIEGPVETFSIVLSNPMGGSLDPPSTAPFVVVDDDGVGDRVALDELEAQVSESYDTLAVAVWRGGPAEGSVQVPYTVAAGPGSPASADDYYVTSANPLVFTAGDRVELVTLSVTNDSLREGDETVELSLSTPTGAEVAGPGRKVLTIADNEETIPPTSRLHHPRNHWSYPSDDYRIREIHVFTADAGGSDVVRAELALRSNLRGGRCAWFTGKRFRPGPCERQRWLRMEKLETDFYYLRMRELPPSAGSSTESYTAFSRALDGAGNLEHDFVKGRNRNTFDVKA
jgi:hypothetical protein